LKTHVFSQASEDPQDTGANTKASNSSDESDNAATEETDAKGQLSDEEDLEWKYSELDEMATKDAQVSKIVLPSSRLSTHLRTCVGCQTSQTTLKYRRKHQNR
jgi:hypothetical protein